MSTPVEVTKGPTDTGAESPTTARPLEMDDDDVQEGGVLGDDGHATSTATPTTTTVHAAPSADNDVPPAKPPRPMSEAQKNLMILKEAFPGVEDAVVKAVLTASGGKVEPAFNALLEMTDPDALKNELEETPPPQPPRPAGRPQMSQLEADEQYARQLAQHYDNVGAYEARTSNRSRGRSENQPGWDDDREHSFLDDDLPVIRENLRKGFLDTQTKVNGWIANIRKKLEENFDESEEAAQRQGQPFRQPGGPSRRSGDYDRYDADPQVLSDDFAGMRFSSDAQGTHSTSNTGMYGRPTPPSTSPRPEGRRVGFKEETEEINMYDSSPKVPPKDTPPKAGAAKASKWQPLSTMEPSPITDNDPFSLGDSEDERETKDKPKDTKDPKEGSSDDSDRLKKAAAEAMADSLVDSTKEDTTRKG